MKVKIKTNPSDEPEDFTTRKSIEQSLKSNMNYDLLLNQLRQQQSQLPFQHKQPLKHLASTNEKLTDYIRRYCNVKEKKIKGEGNSEEVTIGLEIEEEKPQRIKQVKKFNFASKQGNIRKSLFNSFANGHRSDLDYTSADVRENIYKNQKDNDLRTFTLTKETQHKVNVPQKIMVFSPENESSIEEEVLQPPKFFIKRQVDQKGISSHSKKTSQQKIQEYRVLTKDQLKRILNELQKKDNDTISPYSNQQVQMNKVQNSNQKFQEYLKRKMAVNLVQKKENLKNQLSFLMQNNNNSLFLQDKSSFLSQICEQHQSQLQQQNFFNNYFPNLDTQASTFQEVKHSYSQFSSPISQSGNTSIYLNAIRNLTTSKSNNITIHNRDYSQKFIDTVDPSHINVIKHHSNASTHVQSLANLNSNYNKSQQALPVSNKNVRIVCDQYKSQQHKKPPSIMGIEFLKRRMAQQSIINNQKSFKNCSYDANDKSSSTFNNFKH